MALRHCSSSAKKYLGLLDMYLGNGTLFAKTAPFLTQDPALKPCARHFSLSILHRKWGPLLKDPMCSTWAKGLNFHHLGLILRFMRGNEC